MPDRTPSAAPRCDQPPPPRPEDRPPRPTASAAQGRGNDELVQPQNADADVCHIDSAATPSQHFWLREIEHVKELLGSGLWQEKMMSRDLPTEFEDAWKALDALLADEHGQVQFGLHILAKVPYESGRELGELIEERRGSIYRVS